MSEKDAMADLLKAHPQWGKRPISIQKALDCKAIPQGIKDAYMTVMRSLYDVSNDGSGKPVTTATATRAGCSWCWTSKARLPATRPKPK